MVSLARTLSQAVASYVALAAAALAQGAVAIESGRDGLRIPEASSETLAQPGATVPSYLDAARLPQVEEAYRARAARADGGERREHEAGAGEPEDQRDRAASQDVEPQRESERVPRLAATRREGGEGPEDGEESEGGEGSEAAERPAYPPDAAGWAMHAGDAPTAANGAHQPEAAGTEEIEALLQAAERRAAEAEAGRAAEAAARRRAEHTAQTAAKKAADLSRAPRQGDREQADRRGEDAQKPREGGARPQAERAGARRPGRDSDKRANVADPGRQRGAGRAEPPPGRAPPPPPPPEFELPPPRRPFSLLDIFSSGPSEPPEAESSRPVIPDEIRSTGSYMR
jgi:hypothetical protein